MITCTFENGNIAYPGLRHVTIGAICFNDKNEVLLVKRSEKFSRPGTYTLPGGFLDRDETTTEAALRELQEEGGYSGEVVGLFHVNDNPGRPKEDRQNVDFVYLVKMGEGSFAANDEITSAEWFDKNSLPPEDEFAFDHRKTLLKFFEYQEHPFLLPLVGKL